MFQETLSVQHVIPMEDWRGMHGSFEIVQVKVREDLDPELARQRLQSCGKGRGGGAPGSACAARAGASGPALSRLGPPE